MQIAPSLLAADFSALGEEVRALERAGADALHLDVMDGHFVPNLSFGPPLIRSLRPATSLFFDAHLMVSRPADYLEDLRRAGADLITFHVEADGDPAALIRAIRGLGLRAGISLKPGTPAGAVIPYLADLDLVLVMTVEPGFGGQRFREDMMPKLRTLADLRRSGGFSFVLQVDGGINRETIGTAAAAGATCFVAGSAIFRSPDYGAEIGALRILAGRA